MHKNQTYQENDQHHIRYVHSNERATKRTVLSAIAAHARKYLPKIDIPCRLCGPYNVSARSLGTREQMLSHHFPKEFVPEMIGEGYLTTAGTPHVCVAR